MYQSASSGFTQEKGCFPKNMPSVFWWEKHWFWETYPTYFPKEWRIAPNLEDTGSVTVSHIHFRKVRCLTRTIVDREGIQYVYFWDYLWLSDIPIYQCFDACKTKNIFQRWLAYSSNQQQHWTRTYQPILQQSLLQRVNPLPFDASYCPSLKSPSWCILWCK